MGNFYKSIHIGNLIDQRILELEIDHQRVLNFLNIDYKEFLVILKSPSIDTQMLLKLSKVLEYDFFRIYTQHLILYAPPSSLNSCSVNKITNLPSFRKNIYSRNVINFIVDLIKDGKKTKKEIMEEYRIPKTTLYKWINKYNRD